MQAEAPPGQEVRQKPASSQPQTPSEEEAPANISQQHHMDNQLSRQVPSGRKCDEPINENILKIMGDLGIDTNVTREVKSDEYLCCVQDLCLRLSHPT